MSHGVLKIVLITSRHLVLGNKCVLFVQAGMLSFDTLVSSGSVLKHLSNPLIEILSIVAVVWIVVEDDGFLHACRFC